METNNEKVMTFPITETPIVFGALLKERRKKAHLSQKDFAEMMNVTRNTVINWEADKSKPDYNLIPEICALLNIRIHELFRMQPESGLNDLEERIVGNIRRLSPTSRRVIDKMISAMVEEELLARDRELKSTYSLFLVRPGTVAAGTGEYVPAEAPKYVFLRKNNINRCADGIVHVKGHSMEPIYSDGDDVYYKEATCASPGEDVIVDTDDGAIIKRVDDDYTLYSVNPDPMYAYPDKNDQNTLIIRGIVLGTVPSSDRADGENDSLLEELFADEIREFNEKHCVNVWE
jgi:transcriptional regulator with XRE-family HTH domain